MGRRRAPARHARQTKEERLAAEARDRADREELFRRIRRHAEAFGLEELNRRLVEWHGWCPHALAYLQAHGKLRGDRRTGDLLIDYPEDAPPPPGVVPVTRIVVDTSPG